MRTLLLACALALTACSDGTPVALEVVNESAHAVELARFDTGLDTIGTLAGMEAGEHRAQTVLLAERPGHDGSYGVTVRRSDGLDTTFSTGYFTGGLFADSLRLRVYDDSLVIERHERDRWVRQRVGVRDTLGPEDVVLGAV